MRALWRIEDFITRCLSHRLVGMLLKPRKGTSRGFDPTAGWGSVTIMMLPSLTFYLARRTSSIPVAAILAFVVSGLIIGYRAWQGHSAGLDGYIALGMVAIQAMVVMVSGIDTHYYLVPALRQGIAAVVLMFILTPLGGRFITQLERATRTQRGIVRALVVIWAAHNAMVSILRIYILYTKPIEVYLVTLPIVSKISLVISGIASFAVLRSRARTAVP